MAYYKCVYAIRVTHMTHSECVQAITVAHMSYYKCGKAIKVTNMAYCKCKCWGISCEKTRFYAKNSYYFQF
jgi:hypothetical protein